MIAANQFNQLPPSQQLTVLRAETPVVVAPWQLFMDGYNAAIKGAPLEEMQTTDEVEGWWYAVTPHSVGTITEDADFIRMGGA